MGSLLDLVRQSLSCVLKARALKEAVLAVILGSSTPRVASRRTQVEVMEVATGGIVACQELSHHGSDRSWEALSGTDGTCVGWHH